MNAIDIEDGTSIERLVEIESPTPEQLEKLTSRMWIIFRHGDMAFFQYESGSISHERMRSAMAPLLERLQYPQVRAHWRNSKEAFVPAFRTYVDEYIAERWGIENDA